MEESKNKYLFYNTDNEDDESDTSLWMVTFADSMSLLLTFFVLLISFSSFDNEAIVASMYSMNDHLGGGQKKGDRMIKANLNLAEEMDEYMKKAKVELSDTDVPFNVKEKPIKVNNSSFQKTNAIKELLKRNPALIRMLISKKSPPGVKLNKFEESFKEISGDTPVAKDLKLSLQNLRHFVMSEGLGDYVAIDEKANGEISFKIDCIAIFKEGTDEFNEDSKRLLMRIAAILKKLPNKIALEDYGKGLFKNLIAQNERNDLMLRRSLAVLKYLTTVEPDITPERFNIVIRAEPDKKMKKLMDKSGNDGIIGVTIMAYSESMY